ncbi:hypothetical protein [Propylenella binzhouense]|uniref:hypothetical protein n=1 Tax=Propylenella binzhouense TaxID=2555902 RepID=UPI00136D1A7B|nr:hypothetical protein [Propylenella binzhouense]
MKKKTKPARKPRAIRPSAETKRPEQLGHFDWKPEPSPISRAEMRQIVLEMIG